MKGIESMWNDYWTIMNLIFILDFQSERDRCTYRLYKAELDRCTYRLHKAERDRCTYRLYKAERDRCTYRLYKAERGSCTYRLYMAERGSCTYRLYKAERDSCTYILYMAERGSCTYRLYMAERDSCTYRLRQNGTVRLKISFFMEIVRYNKFRKFIKFGWCEKVSGNHIKINIIMFRLTAHFIDILKSSKINCILFFNIQSSLLSLLRYLRCNKFGFIAHLMQNWWEWKSTQFYTTLYAVVNSG